MKPQKSLILQAGCDAVLAIIQDRTELSKKDLRFKFKYARWKSAIITDVAEGCRLIQVPEDARQR